MKKLLVGAFVLIAVHSNMFAPISKKEEPKGVASTMYAYEKANLSDKLAALENMAQEIKREVADPLLREYADLQGIEREIEQIKQQIKQLDEKYKDALKS